MIRFRFLQLSDLHLGGSLVSPALNLPAEKRALRQQELEQLITSLPQWVEAHQLDALLLPGDLWDHEVFSRSNIELFRLFYNTLYNLPIPVVITPGNHDYYSTTSFYHPERLKALGFAPWPEHICIFTTPAFQRIALPGWEDKVFITGRAFQTNSLIDPQHADHRTRLLKQLDPLPPGETVEILVFHGSRDDANRFDEKVTAPFSLAEILALNYDYTAIGHYHRPDIMKSPDGSIKAAYSGCPFTRHLDEKHPNKCAFIGEIIKEGTRVSQLSLEPLITDQRNIVEKTFSITGLPSAEALCTQLLVDSQASAKENDMLLYHLTGKHPVNLLPNWESLEETLNQIFFHAKLNTQDVEPDYDIEALAQDPYSLEGRFTRAMQEKLDAATSDTEKHQLAHALSLGLDALLSSEVRRLCD